MLPTVPVPPRHLDEFREVAGDEAVDRLRAAAEPLAGARVLNINATAFGGGVSELLLTQVGLMNDLGIHTTWQVIEGSDAFFTITKFMHNGMQGAEVPWDDETVRIYEDQNRLNADLLAHGFDHDFVLIHDPQPAALLTALDDMGVRKGTWAWRCHIDLSAPFAPIWDYLATHVERYDGAVFTIDEFVPPGFQGAQTFIIPPSIDPLSAKNQWIDPDTVYEILHRYGVQWTKPIATQVSRFDPWKDPLGVIDAYRKAREEVPDLQLVMIASMAHDDPEGWHYQEVTERYRQDDPNIFLLSNLQGVGNLEVNAFQRDSNVVLQKSLKEGFGLTVSEAMWKGTPVIGGNVGGIRLQIEDGISGFLVDSVDECATRMVELLTNDELNAFMAEAGRQRVRERFLTLRELEDLIAMMVATSGKGA